MKKKCFEIINFVVKNKTSYSKKLKIKVTKIVTLFV